MNLFGRDKEMTFLLSMVLRKQAISGHFSFRNELIQRNLRGKFEYFFCQAQPKALLNLAGLNLAVFLDASASQ